VVLPGRRHARDESERPPAPPPERFNSRLDHGTDLGLDPDATGSRRAAHISQLLPPGLGAYGGGFAIRAALKRDGAPRMAHRSQFADGVAIGKITRAGLLLATSSLVARLAAHVATLASSARRSRHRRAGTGSIGPLARPVRAALAADAGGARSDARR